MVLFYHCGVVFGIAPYAVSGATGVHFFFVLSGFLLFRPYAAAFANRAEWPSTGDYLLRRIMRILPPYWVALAVFVAVRYATKTNIPSTWDVFTHALLVFNYDYRLNFFGINPVFWSLAIEMQFYFLLPLAASMTRRLPGSVARSWVLVIAFFAIGVVARLSEAAFIPGGMSIDTITFRTVFAYLDLFACGMAVAAWHAARPADASCRPAIGTVILIGGVSIFLAANVWGFYDGGMWQSARNSLFLAGFSPAVCCGCALIVAGLTMTPPDRLRWLTIKPLVAIGTVAYSLYLYHTGVEFVVAKLHIGQQWPWVVMAWANALISLPLALAVSLVFYRQVEVPCLRRISARRAKPREVNSDASVVSLPDPLMGP